MKKILYVMISCAFITIIVPLLIVAIMGGLVDNTKGDTELISVYFHQDNTTKKINMEEYLVGVVCAEMNAVFNDEALKAQAVAARTYTQYKLSHKSSDNPHKDAMICTDSTHCQAWTDINKKIDEWGPNASQNYEKIKKAVSSTANEIMMYNGEIVNALFHSTSSGNTENAADVWGKDIPYLVSVKSDGEEASPRFTSTETISKAEFCQKAEENIENTDFSKDLFSDIVRSDAGGIKTLRIGGVEIAGTLLRSIYELRSTNVDIIIDGENIVFNVKGNGHGVGMSQYGANHLAATGYNYKDILTHYYTGVEIVSMY